MQELVDLGKLVIQNHHVGGLCRHIAVVSDRNTDTCCHHRRCIIDSVPDIECLGHRRFLANNLQLLLRTLLRQNLLDSNLLGQIPHLGFPIPRNDHGFGDTVVASQMVDERFGVQPRSIVHAIDGRIAIIDRDDTLESFGGLGHVLESRDGLLADLLATRYENLLALNASGKPHSWTFAHRCGRISRNALGIGRRDDRMGQRMLGVML